MAEQPSEIMHEIEEQRQHLAEHLQELHEKVEQATDWRAYLRTKPALVIAIALAGAFVSIFIARRIHAARKS